MTSKLLDRVFEDAKIAFVPPMRIRHLDWAQRVIKIPPGLSSMPGPYVAQKYLHDIFDAIDSEDIPRVTILKPARVGLSLALATVVLGRAANRPCQLGHLLSTEQDARETVTGVLEPLALASGLKGLLEPGEVEESARNLMLVRRGENFSYHALSSRAARSYKMLTFSTVLADEVDSYQASAVSDTSPVALLERRTMTYPDFGPNGRKIILCSTPEDIETSLILRAWEAGDQRVYESCCSYQDEHGEQHGCGGLTEIIFKNHIVWDRPDGPVFFQCPHCGHRADSRFRKQLVENGGWHALKSTNGHASFRFNSFISDLANADWRILRDEFLKAKEDPLQLREFVTQVLGQGWQSIPDVDAGAAASRRENFSIEAIPEEVRFLLAATDWHDDRIEVLITGWSPTACFCLAHAVLDGDVLTDDSIMWALKDILETKWQHPYGAGKIGAGKIQILGCLCDEGDGDHTVRVREFVKSMRRTGFRNIFSAKGNAGQRQLLKRSKTEKGLMLVGTNQGKDQVFAILKSGKSSNSSLRFSSSLPAEFFPQLAAEKKVVIKKGGMFVSRYERIGSQPNEALDLIVYNFALRTRFNPVPWDLLEQRLRGAGDPQPLPETMDAAGDVEEAPASAPSAPKPSYIPRNPFLPQGYGEPRPERSPQDDPSRPVPQSESRPAAIGSWMSQPPKKW